LARRNSRKRWNSGTEATNGFGTPVDIAANGYGTWVTIANVEQSCATKAKTAAGITDSGFARKITSGVCCDTVAHQGPASL
jgi:hypothetical protein